MRYVMDKLRGRAANKLGKNNVMKTKRMAFHVLVLNSFPNCIFIFINYWLVERIDCHLESVGTGQEEKETNS